METLKYYIRLYKIMVIKTFNVSEDTYKKFAEYCKGLGISMSKQVDMFMKSQIADDPKVRKSYLEKLDSIRKGTFVKSTGSLMDKY